MNCPLIDWSKMAIEHAIEHSIGTDLANELITILDSIDGDSDIEDDDTESDNCDKEIDCHPGMEGVWVKEVCRCCGHETHIHQDVFDPAYSLT